MNSPSLELSPGSMSQMPNGDVPAVHRAHYEPPWANTSIIGIAGSSGSGKTSLSLAIINELSLPWVVLLSMDAFYKPLSPTESKAAFRNEYDFDAPEAIDFDTLVERLHEIKAGYATVIAKRACYSLISIQARKRIFLSTRLRDMRGKNIRQVSTLLTC